MKHPTDPIALFLLGPALLLFVVSALAVVSLIAAGLGLDAKLAALGARAARRLQRGRALPTLWGLSAVVLIFAMAALLFSTKVLALLGLLVLICGLALLGLGVGVAAVRAGRDLSRALGRGNADKQTSLTFGLAAFFLAAFLPLLGWITVLLAGASGLGAVVECMLVRERTEKEMEQLRNV